MELTILGTAHQWTLTEPVLLWLARLTERDVLEARPGCGVRQKLHVSGRLGRFHLAPIANGAAVDTGVQTFGPGF